jgi:hypothetical protein
VVAQDAPELVRASGRVALESHLLGFAAERARIEGQAIDMRVFREEVDLLARS